MLHDPHRTPQPDSRGHVAHAERPTRHRATAVVANALRGGLVGMAELVPGVSGGTIALVTGVYGRLLAAASHAIDAGRALVTGPDRIARARASLRRVDWWLVVPFVVGMGLMVVSMAGIMKGFVLGQPVASRALFFGMVAASIAVPLAMARRVPGGSTWRSIALVAAGFLVAVSIAGGGVEIADPPLLLVFGAAALAVCALALPGVSGSYLLLILGLYTATTGAVAERNLTYLAVFAAGALIGLGVFVKVLGFLFTRYRRGTLLVMSGLMLGSLRALWPWQDDSATPLVPGADWPAMALVAVLGAAAVLALLRLEKRFGSADHPASHQPIPARATQTTSIDAA